jgi:replication factor C small subunit
MERVRNILEAENIPYEDSVLAQLITKYFPDFRRVLNELQRYSVAGIIDVGILSQVGQVQVKELTSSMKSKNFTEARKWVVSNLDNSQTELFRKMYDGLHEYMEPSSIPQAILILAEYQYKSAFVADQEINLTACVVELMMECEFK